VAQQNPLVVNQAFAVARYQGVFVQINQIRVIGCRTITALPGVGRLTAW